MDIGVPAYEYVTTLLVALAAPLAGVRIVLWLLPRERRSLLLLGIGAPIGIGLTTFALPTLATIVPLYVAVGIVQVISAGLAIWAVIELRLSRLRAESGRPVMLAATAFVALVLFATAVGYISSIWYENSHENLLIQLALSAHFTAGNWPPIHPWEPDHVQNYRFGGQLWTAATALSARADVFTAGLAATLVATASLLLGVYALIRLLVGRATGLLAAVLVAISGPQNFLSLILARYPDYSPSVAYTLAEHLNRFKQGYILGTSFEQLASFNFTFLIGLAGAVGAAALVTAMAKSDSVRWPAVVVAAAAIGGASVTAEHLFPILVGTIAIVALVQLLRRRPLPAAHLAAVVALGTLASLVPAGPLNSALFGASGTPGYLRLGASDLFSLPTREILAPGSTSIFFATEPISRAHLLGPLMWQQFGWVLVGIAGAAVLAAWRRNHAIAVPALAATITLSIPGVLHDTLNPHNTGRFLVVGLILAAMSLAILVTALWELPARRKVVGRLAGTGLVMLAGGTWLLTLPLLPMEFQEYESPVLTDELEAAGFAAALPYPQRALLLPGPRTFAELNSDDGDGMHKYAVTFGRLQVPMGFDNLGRREEYADAYARAQDTLDADALEQLQVDLVYVATDQLSRDQEELIKAAVVSGTLRPVFASSNDARRLYATASGVGNVAP
jgi:hypothetical protein